jgi:hypothetical protein
MHSAVLKYFKIKYAYYLKQYQSCHILCFSAGRKVICYFSAGTYEPGRLDISHLPSSVKGHHLADWPDEKWLDIRSQTVKDIMVARIATAKARHCDGVEPDNVDGYQDHKSGFPLTAHDQIQYNTFLANG